MKRFVATFIIVAILLLVTPFCVANENSLTRLQAIEIIESQLGLDVPEDTRLELRPDYEDESKKIWELNWSTSPSEGKGEVFYYISLDSDANIRSYFLHDTRPREIDLSTCISRDEARDIVMDFINRVAPDKIPQIREKPTYETYSGLEDLNFKFEFEQVVKGIPFPENTISIEVLSDGTVKSYNLDWDEDIEFEKVNNIISQTTAENLFKQNTSVALRYVQDSRQDQIPLSLQPSLRLVYSPVFKKSSYIDASNGKFIDSLGKHIEETELANIKGDIRPKAKSVTGNGALITKDEAFKIVKDIVKYDTIKESERSFVETFLGSDKKYIKYDFIRTQKGEGFFRSWVYASAIVNLDIGKIIFLNMNLTDQLKAISSELQTDTDKNSANEIITWEEGLEIAENYIKTLFPEEFSKTYLVSKPYQNTEQEKPKQYFYQFVRMVEGIPFDEDGFYVNIDSRDKNIMAFRFSWSDKPFPKPEGIIKEEKAKKILNKSLEVELIYMTTSKDSKKPFLVYTVKNAHDKIDALTGDVLVTGSTPKEKIMSKIRGSKAEKELAFLIDQGIINDFENFNPDSSITRQDIIKLIVLSKVKDLTLDTSKAILPTYADVDINSPYFYYIEAAAKHDLIPKSKKIYPKRELSREELAQILINLMGYKEVASFNDIYDLKIKDIDDISESKKGAVTLALAFEIMDTKDGKFYPNDNATWEDAAFGLFKAASKIKK